MVVLVTVTVYVPDTKLFIDDVVALFLHRYVTPVAVAVALPLTGVQLVTSVLVQLTGNTELERIVAEQVDVHAPSVTVTV